MEDLTEQLTEGNYPAMYILQEGEIAEEAIKKMMASGKLVLNKKDLPKIMEILNDAFFIMNSTEQQIYDKIIKKTFGISR